MMMLDLEATSMLAVFGLARSAILPELRPEVSRDICINGTVPNVKPRYPTNKRRRFHRHNSGERPSFSYTMTGLDPLFELEGVRLLQMQRPRRRMKTAQKPPPNSLSIPPLFPIIDTLRKEIDLTDHRFIVGDDDEHIARRIELFQMSNGLMRQF